jgi:hypothetical protein
MIDEAADEDELTIEAEHSRGSMWYRMETSSGVDFDLMMG